MSQGEPGIELDTSLGYMLKAAASALHSALEAVLRPLGMTITHYSCLELLAQRPGLSNSELARQLTVASAAVRRVEQDMLANLDASEQDQMRRLLTACIAALTEPPGL
jgi:hypothetical protein